MSLIPSPGTITVTNGSTSISGTGTAFTTLRQGYGLLLPDGRMITLASDPDANGAATITLAWSDTTVTDSVYQALPREIGSQIALEQRINNQMLSATDAISAAVSMKFETATADEQPSDGYLRIVSATQINVSDTDVGGTDVSALLAQFVGGLFLFRSALRPQTLLVYQAVAITDEDGWSNITVALVSGTAIYQSDESLVLIGTVGADGLQADEHVADLAARAAFDEETAGFTVLVDDTGDSRSGIYTLITPHATTPVWAGPAYVTGTTGAAWDQWRGAWLTATAYAANDVVENDGGSYICLSAHTSGDLDDEPGVGAVESTHWDLIAAKGDPGADSVITGTSTTSVTIGLGSKGPLTTQAGIGWVVGTRVRLVSAVNAANYMEGPIAAYSGTSLTVTVDKIGGSGTLNDWNISIAGVPGANGANGGMVGAPLRAGSITNIDLSTALENGDSAGGVILAAGDVFGAFGQSTAAQNGIYVVQASGAAVRHTDFNSYNEIAGGIFTILEGTLAGDWYWCTSAKGGTIDITNLVFEEFSASGTNQRDALGANRDYYVDGSSGSDSNDGLASGAGAFATIQKALDVVGSLDINIYDVNINVADGTYAESLVLKPPVGSGTLNLIGNTTTPSSCIISATSANCISLFRAGSEFRLSGFQTQITTGTTSSHIMVSAAGATVVVDDWSFAGGAVYAHGIVRAGGFLQLITYECSGAATFHLRIDNGGGGTIVLVGGTKTFAGTPVWSAAGIGVAGSGCHCVAYGAGFSGGATGVRYTASLNGVIETDGGGASYFPGNASGSVATGGVYA